MSVPSLDELALASINEQQASDNTCWLKVISARKRIRENDLGASEEELKSLKKKADAIKHDITAAKKELKALNDAHKAVSTE